MQRKSSADSGIRDGKVQRSSVGNYVSTSSGVVRKKRCRETDNALTDCLENNEDGPGDGGILSNAMEEDFQQLTEKMDYFTHQVHLHLKCHKSNQIRDNALIYLSWRI